MPADVKDVATRLYHKVKRLNDGKVATVGFGKSNAGRDVLVVYFLEGSSYICPNNFEGYGVVVSKAQPKAESMRV